MESIELKRLKSEVPREVDQAFNEHALKAEKWAGMVRLGLALIFAVACARAWSQPETHKYIYLGIAIAWLVTFVLVRIRVKQGTSEVLITLTTLIDISIVNFGLLLFAWQETTSFSGPALFFCYFPLLAVAASRYRTSLVLIAGVYAGAFYSLVSLIAFGNPLYRVGILLLTTVVCAFGTRKPRDLMINVAGRTLESAFNLGANRKEIELTAIFHEAIFPPAILDLPMIWSSSKHLPGTETTGDYYQVFETERGPLLFVADLGGHGKGDIRDFAQLHHALLRIVLEEVSPQGVLQRLNRYVWQTYSGKRSLTCFVARWDGDTMEYGNAAHLPALHLSRNNRSRLGATSGAVGEREDGEFATATVAFPARDLLLVYTDGLYSKLTDDREHGVAEIEGLTERFSHGEINTLCHRVFDCALPGLDEPKDDCTLVVIRRQPKAAEESKAKSGAEG